ncbi:MAG: Pr6Pr family membrane protein [Bacteroidota bacterium]
MKRYLSILFALIGWFAVIAQYFLMIENRIESIAETTIRFFSFFTILTNTLVATYFTCLPLPGNKRPEIIDKPGTLTAVTVYIVIVGLVYQVALRHVWQPEGLQLIVDELLHTIMPVLVIVFWYLYEIKKPVHYSRIQYWAVYPLVYLIYILIRGRFSNFYPYPFINVTNLGIGKTLVNAGMVLLVFLAIATIFIFIGKSVGKRQAN